MAGRARLLLTAVALAPLPLLAAVAWTSEAEAAGGLPQAVVSVRDGDLFVGERQLTSGGGDSDPDWSPDRRQIAMPAAYLLSRERGDFDLTKRWLDECSEAIAAVVGSLSVMLQVIQVIVHRSIDRKWSGDSCRRPGAVVTPRPGPGLRLGE